MLAFYLNEIGHAGMAEFFRDDSDGDLHTLTASEMFSVGIGEVNEKQRQAGKRCNFSVVYGGGTPTLVKQKAAKDFEEAAEMLFRFHNAWPGIGWESKVKRSFGLPVEAARGTLLDLIKTKVRERGYVTTLWGRHLHPRSDHSALNALLQGGAADLMKWAMVQVHGYMNVAGPGRSIPMESHMVNTVHDELIIDARKHEVPYIAREVPKLMTYERLQAVVPIVPSPDISWTNWAEKEEYIEPTRNLWVGNGT